MKFLFVIIIFTAFSANTPAQAPKSDINSLKWITGCWANDTNNKSVTEQWMKPAGNTMIGMSRTVNNGKTTAFEFLRLVQENADIFYIAKPSKQEETSFKLVKQTETEVVFENPTHDFPQRIIYQLKDKDFILARIEGENKGKKMGFDFPMKRAKCD